MEYPQPTYDSSRPRRLILDELRELIQYKDLVRNLVRRNVTSRYKRSVLGILWTLLDPLFTMIVMAVVFGALFETAVPRFSLFLLSGIMIWNFISQSSTQAIADLMYGGGLMNQVYMSRSVYAFAAFDVVTRQVQGILGSELRQNLLFWWDQTVKRVLDLLLLFILSPVLLASASS